MKPCAAIAARLAEAADIFSMDGLFRYPAWWRRGHHRSRRARRPARGYLARAPGWC
jgi:hypothetical protein